MKTLALVPIGKTKSDLPQWQPPSDLEKAAAIICELGHDLHEHAYLVGKTLLWVQQKVGNRKLTPWVKKMSGSKKRRLFGSWLFLNCAIENCGCWNIIRVLKTPIERKKELK